MKYTPGPWRMQRIEPPLVEYAGWWIKKDDDIEFPIAFITETIGGTKPPQKANAHLIAAAPNLLEACKLIVEHYGKDKYDPAIIACKQAIAKAEGKIEP